MGESTKPLRLIVFGSNERGGWSWSILAWVKSTATGGRHGLDTPADQRKPPVKDFSRWENPISGSLLVLLPRASRTEGLRSETASRFFYSSRGLTLFPGGRTRVDDLCFASGLVLVSLGGNGHQCLAENRR
jgi:hypothetical protein